MDMDIRNDTETKGPYDLEWKGSNVIIRSNQPFRYQISLPQMPARKQGKKHVSQPVGLVKGETMVLTTVGHDDIVIEGR